MLNKLLNILPRGTILNFVFAAYRGCYSKSNIPSGNSAIYASKTSMTIGFCTQLCMADASDPSNEPRFIALSVRI